MTNIVGKNRRHTRAKPRLQQTPPTARPNARLPGIEAEGASPASGPARSQMLSLSAAGVGDIRLKRIEDEVVAIVNRERFNRGLPRLRIDERLRASARAHSQDMAQRNYFAHRSPDGTTPAERMRAWGHPQPGAENIAMGQPRPQVVMTAWMQSPGHRANILHPQLQSIGVGLYRAKAGQGPWWTQHFGYDPSEPTTPASV
ncbi:CAP domain-containing protein [Actinacidiphila glaucinigra]|uniref:CAP domain-containing protein n=1 Tax=Actinacidiphila glaucinigra TaxID=235986 RepID=UPI0035D9040C